MPAQTQAFALVGAELATLFPGKSLAEPEVQWWTDKCPGSERSAVILGSSCYSGLYYRAGAIDVAWRGKFGESAYTHELMHYFLDQHFGDSDPQHQRTSAWAVVNHADEHLQRAGM